MISNEYLSISIDLVDSTFLKSKIMQVCLDDDTKNEKIGEMFNYLINLEQKLYETAYRGKFLERVFIVKSIGDEIWYVLDLTKLTPHKRESIVRNIVNSLQSIALEFSNFTIMPTKQQRPILKVPAGSHKANLINKITIDLIAQAFNFSRERISKLNKFYYGLLTQSKPTSVAKKRYRKTLSEIAHNLNMGQIRKEDANGMFIFEPRFDLVGTEVDRFFRITKFSIPGLVMAGESLYNTYLSAKSSAKGLRYPSDPEVLQPKDLKGLSTSYTVHYLPAQHQSYHQFPAAQKRLMNSGFLGHGGSINSQKWALP